MKVVTEKHCPGCGETKAAAEFAPAPYRYDGLRARCRTCTTIGSREQSKRRVQKRYEPIMEGAKICKGCQIEKDISEFSVDRIFSDGRRNKCKECESARISEYNASREITDEMRARWRTNRRNRNQEDPRQRAAQNAITVAINSGRLDPVSAHECAAPGCEEQAKNYHHWSYEEENWLSLIPLCVSHHRQIHTGRLVLEPIADYAISGEPPRKRKLADGAEVKFCHGCEKDLPLSYFGRDRTKPYGGTSRCRECNRKDRQESKSAFSVN